MEPFVKSLYDRLDENKKMQLFCIEENAINEMHNNGVISKVDPTGTSKLHDSDPNIRLIEKAKLAKSVGKQFVVSSTPVPDGNGKMKYITAVSFDPRFENSICLCIQGGLEGLYISGIMKTVQITYLVMVQDKGKDLTQFKTLISQLNSFYDDIEVKVVTGIKPNEETKPSTNTNRTDSFQKEKKQGFFSKIFQKKTKPQNGESATDVKSMPSERNGSAYALILTSQLVALWLDKGQQKYKEEYLRRMKICGLSDDASMKMFEYEAEIIKMHPRPEMLDESFISKPLFSLTKTALDKEASYYETHFEYPFSYIVKLSDEAEWHYWNSHEKNLNDRVWSEILELSDQNKKLFLPFATDLLNRGWSVGNVNKFSFHEQGMLDKYRWKRSFTSAAKEPWKE